MKFQLKALAVALALVAAVPAQAAMDDAQTGNSSLVLAVYDKTANISALFDLGKNYSDFNVAGASFANSGITNPGTVLNWNLSSGDYATAWSTYFATATLANSVYAIVSTDNLGAGAGNRGLISTYSSFATNPTTGQLQTVAQNFSSMLNNNQTSTVALYENHTLVANGGSVIPGSTPGFGYSPNYFGNSKNFGLGPIAVGSVGTDLGVFQYTSAATTFVTPTLTTFGNSAKFNLASNGSLVYSTLAAPIPEADTWAMMLLGLGFMGFVARRKQA